MELLERGDTAEILDIHGDPPLVHRLAELGVRIGTRVRVLQPGCPCLLQVGSTRLSVRLTAALQILVQPVGCPRSEVA
jgi:Fe2+ transport system protein FeoA